MNARKIRYIPINYGDGEELACWHNFKSTYSEQFSFFSS
jgi:hypothetical protein